MMMLRLLVGDCFLIAFFGGTFSPELMECVFSAELMRKKLDGGGVSGGLIFGCGNLAIGCGSMVLSLNFPVKITFWPVAESKTLGVCLGCCAGKSGGMV